MDRIKEKLQKQADQIAALEEEVSELKAEIKKLQQEATNNEVELSSCKNKNTMLEADVDKLEGQLKTAKAEALEGAQHGTAKEGIQRKVTVLEEENENLDKLLKETTEKLRLTDIKADHNERKLQAAEQERDAQEAKYEEKCKELKKVQDELEELSTSLASL